jgi:hypothetical protein
MHAGWKMAEDLAARLAVIESEATALCVQQEKLQEQLGPYRNRTKVKPAKDKSLVGPAEIADAQQRVAKRQSRVVRVADEEDGEDWGIMLQPAVRDLPGFFGTMDFNA